MDCKFVIGQKVVCVRPINEDDLKSGLFRPLEVGQIYSIRSVHIGNHYITGEEEVSVYVEEIYNNIPSERHPSTDRVQGEPGYCYRHFQSLDDQLDVFNKMLVEDCPKTEKKYLKELETEEAKAAMLATGGYYFGTWLGLLKSGPRKGNGW